MVASCIKLFKVFVSFILFLNALQTAVEAKSYCTRKHRLELIENELVEEMGSELEKTGGSSSSLRKQQTKAEAGVLAREILEGTRVVDELKIHGGKPVEHIRQLPFLASLWVECRRLCTCSVISPVHILSAGHCFGLSGNYTVMAGTIDAVENNTESLWRHVKKVHVYSEDIFGKDLAIAELDSPLDGFDVQPVALSSLDVPINETAYIAGWGRINDGSSPVTLQSANVTIWPNEDEKCEGVLKTEICAFGKGGENTCFGDSGGPLLHKNPKTDAWEQIGITSRGSWLCEFKGFFTTIRLYCDWIRETTEGKAKCS